MIRNLWIIGLLVSIISGCATVTPVEGIGTDPDITGLSKEYRTVEQMSASGLVPDDTGYCEMKRDRESGESYILFIGPDKEVSSRFLLPEGLMLPLMSRLRISIDGRYYFPEPMQVYPWAMVRAHRLSDLFVIEKGSGAIIRLTAYEEDRKLRFFCHNLTFSRDGSSVIYHEWNWTASDDFSGVRVVKLNIATGKREIILELPEEIRYYHTLEVRNGLYLTAASLPGYAPPTDVLIYDESEHETIPLFSLDTGCENAYWIRDYSRDQSRVLLCHSVYTACVRDADVPFDLFFDNVSRLAFFPDRSMTIDSVPVGKSTFITNAKMTPGGRYCVHTLYDSYTRECRLVIYDFDNGKEKILLEGDKIRKESGEDDVLMGFPPLYQTMIDGLFLSDNYNLMIRVNDLFRVYTLETK